MSLQKQLFLESEGDAWFLRNNEVLAKRDPARDVVCQLIENLCTQQNKPAAVLEIGCGDGKRLKFLQDRVGCKATGLDPSKVAVEAAQINGVHAVVGTAEELPFEGSRFDVVIFGFCLYLCDDVDLFQIAREADRVLKSPGWVLMLDFDSAEPKYNKYHHRDGVFSRKMDYKSMFLWHPNYTLAHYQKFDHQTLEWTDDKQEWVSLAALRKTSRAC
jgi:ubiquinone/menaquinone biosynthesis C-methylase UbiE